MRRVFHCDDPARLPRQLPLSFKSGRGVGALVQKHHRVVGERAFADPKSSARTFDGFARPRWLFDDAVDWPRVEPRTWLLDLGWRRRSLIDPASTIRCRWST